MTAFYHPLDIPFVKMHGLGNDFIMLHCGDLPDAMNTNEAKRALAKQWCNRHWGIGADGLIIAQLPTTPGAVATFDYWNSDGTIAQMCGNGIRCFAHYLREQGWTNATNFDVDSPIGLMHLIITENNLVTVNMGSPILDGTKFPCNLPLAQQTTPPVDIPVSVEGTEIPMTLVSMGNPHALIFTDELDHNLDPAQAGPVIEQHSIFPERTNVEFVSMQDDHHASVVVWERGCGFTQACGTGACATAVGAILKGKAASPITITLPGGDLHIEWDSNTQHAPVMMTGPATTVFKGTFTVETPSTISASMV